MRFISRKGWNEARRATAEANECFDIGHRDLFVTGRWSARPLHMLLRFSPFETVDREGNYLGAMLKRGRCPGLRRAFH